jgi:probable rRNA maturation factor
MIYLQIEDALSEQGISPVELAILEKAALQTLHHSNAELHADMTLVITDDAQLQQLNREFLSIDAPTDVLSFPGGDTDPDTQMLYLGDVIISLPRAAAQAAAGGHAVEAELQLLVVHGTLHLLGFDHADPAGKAQMWQAQADVLTSLGCPITGPASE